MDAKRVLSAAEFKQRAAQLLNSYGMVKANQQHSSLTKLVRGMPERLRKCKARKYGRCGK